MIQEKQGIKETSDVFELGFTFGELLYDEVVEDGFQPVDLLTVFTSEKFQRKIAEAFNGITLVPGEIKALKASDAFSLGRKALESFERIAVKYEKEF